MNNDRISISKYGWVGMVAVFLLIFGVVWTVSAPREAPPAATIDSNPSARNISPSYEAFDRNYADRIPAGPPLPPAPVVGSASGPPPAVVVTPVAPQAAPQATQPKPLSQAAPKPHEVTPRDMFPVGNIARDLPNVDHPYRQLAELYPSFQYRGKLWLATGRFVLSSQADLVPTGLRLKTGQYLFMLSDQSKSDTIVFVQSELDPGKFAVYRAG